MREISRAEVMMERTAKHQLMWMGLMVLVVFSGLCTIFVLVLTTIQAWQERTQARWPEVTAHVERCGLTRTSTGRRRMRYIDCRLSYLVGAEEQATNIYSTIVPPPEVWQYPPNQIAPFERWVDEHPPGTPITVQYDPNHHSKIVLAGAYMPRGGPRTPSNVKLLGVMAGGFLVLLAIARITRPRTVWNAGISS